MEGPRENHGVEPDSERPPILSDLPRRPERPALPEPTTVVRQPASSAVTIGGALVGLMLLSVILLICTGGNLVALIASFGIFAFAALHYVVWGWWLGRMIHDEEMQERPHDDDRQQ